MVALKAVLVEQVVVVLEVQAQQTMAILVQQIRVAVLVVELAAVVLILLVRQVVQESLSSVIQLVWQYRVWAEQ
jgi:hypothetical protein